MEQPNHLHILWTNADPLTSQFMVMMYATNSKSRRWWEEVTVIIWGATARLAAEDAAIKDCIKIAQHAGVKFSACIACARQLGVTELLEAQDIELLSWGPPLTELIQSGAPLITV